jgi:hypothetical protein
MAQAPVQFLLSVWIATWQMALGWECMWDHMARREARDGAETAKLGNNNPFCDPSINSFLGQCPMTYRPSTRFHLLEVPPLQHQYTGANSQHQKLLGTNLSITCHSTISFPHNTVLSFLFILPVILRPYHKYTHINMHFFCSFYCLLNYISIYLHIYIYIYIYAKNPKKTDHHIFGKQNLIHPYSQVVKKVKRH